MREIFANAAGRVDHFADGNIVMESLYGNVAGAELRELYVAALECATASSSRAWLSESRSLQPLSAEDVHWINWTWFPRMQALGWRFWAIVRPVSPLALAGFQDFVRTYRSAGVTVELFDDVGCALHWLRKAQLAMISA